MLDYFVGRKEIVDNMMVCLLAGGHVLLEDVPGVGKTTLACTLARLIDCDFGRIQFTPDTLPGDVVGVSMYNMKTGEFEYRDGEVMHQIVHQIVLSEPFMVIATQNPMGYTGSLSFRYVFRCPKSCMQSELETIH